MVKYYIKNNTTGVYKITCNITKKFYIGASVNIPSRLSNHMNRDARRYKEREFYKDVLKYGFENFTFEVLEVCHKDDLLEREQYYYDLLKPEYNEVKPSKNNFLHELVRKKSNLKSNSPEAVAKRKELFNSPEYRQLFRDVHTEKMKPIVMTDLEGNKLFEFKSMQECSRWLDENTNFKGKNKTSKIKAVADGERPTAYGYKFHYTTKRVETIL